jgi:hypothetical protein
MAAETLPQFAFIVPNQYNDMHTNRNQVGCQLGSALQNQVCQGDTWLKNNVPALQCDRDAVTTQCRNDVTVLILFDEGTSRLGGGGHVAAIETGPNVCQGCTFGDPTTHLGVLRAIAQWFALPELLPPPAEL